MSFFAFAIDRRLAWSDGIRLEWLNGPRSKTGSDSAYRKAAGTFAHNTMSTRHSQIQRLAMAALGSVTFEKQKENALTPNFT
jgi:hypothetical protein